MKIEAKAIEEGWSPEKFELAALREGRPKAPAVHGVQHDTGPQVLEAALCRTVGIKDVEKQYEPKILEAADREFRHSLGLQELLTIQAQANGWTGRMFRSDGQTMREILAAAFTGHTLAGNILSNTANKAILESFNAVESAWRKIAAIGRVSDFKTATRYRLTGDATYEELGAGGEIQHGTLDAQEYTIRAKTYARMFAITREDIIN
ncbi:MAG: hypothetical protein GWN87_32550, partial [Desulfuromonadales bacterium]|nr:hypothetical protein [Desulfuromonadales bacterium]